MGISCELSFQEHGKEGWWGSVYLHLPHPVGQDQLDPIIQFFGFHWEILERAQGVKKNDSPCLHFDHTGTCGINSEFRVA